MFDTYPMCFLRNLIVSDLDIFSSGDIFTPDLPIMTPSDGASNDAITSFDGMNSETAADMVAEREEYSFLEILSKKFKGRYLVQDSESGNEFGFCWNLLRERERERECVSVRGLRM